MQRPLGIRIIVTLIGLLPVILIVVVAGLSWESFKWSVVLIAAPFSTIWYPWLFAMWYHRNWSRWLLNICALMLAPLWLTNLSIADSPYDLWMNRFYLALTLALAIYMNLPKVRRWFLQPRELHPDEQLYELPEFDRADPATNK